MRLKGQAGHSAQALGSCFDKVKAAIHRSKHTAPDDAVSIKCSNVQETDLAKSHQIIKPN
jgi:hypothetical protein